MRPKIKYKTLIKCCNKCRVELGDHNWNPGLKNNKTNTCTSCHNKARRKKYRRADKTAATAYKKAWVENNPVSVMLSSAKERARIKGLEFSLTPEDINIPDVCPVFGIELKRNLGGNRKRIDNSPSLDRIDPSKGYIPGNVAVISWRANSLKRDGFPDELEAIAKWMRTAPPN